MSILVLGANGQVGRALIGTLVDEEAVFLSRDEIDLSDSAHVKETIHKFLPPRAIINAAAYTAVDKAEEEAELAHKINAESVGVLADYCAQHNVPFIHYSTDYVYDGSGDNPRDESTETAPLNVYGESKLAGEKAIASSGCDYLIFRTSWVYDAEGKNFFNTMLRLAKTMNELSVVDDQIGAPSYAPHLADATFACLQKAESMGTFPSGIYHMCNAGETSWKGFAEAIFAAANDKGASLAIETVNGISTEAYPTPATRPLNSRLDCSKLQQTFDVTLPDWREGVTVCMEIKHEDHEWAA